MSRKIILHYHLFKNAGSSIDRLLRESYGSDWINYDKDEPSACISAQEIGEYIYANPGLRAISSHQVMPPLPQGDLDVFPIVFLRDPVLRVKSAWLFEWKKQLGLDEPKGSLSDYINEKLHSRKGAIGTVIANFQVMRLSNVMYEATPIQRVEHENEQLELAIEFLRSIPFFGLVERFDESLELLAARASADFPDMKYTLYQENVTQESPLSQNDQFDLFRAEVGDEMFNEVLLRNRLDIQLYRYAQGLFDARYETEKSVESRDVQGLAEELVPAVASIR